MDLVTKVKLRTLQSPVDTVVACILIRTSLSFGSWFVHLLELEKIGRSVLGVQNRFHKCSLWGCHPHRMLQGVRVSCLNGLMLVAGYVPRKGQRMPCARPCTAR